MIRGLHQFGLTVSDVDASAAWYEEVLRFRRVGEFTAPDGGGRALGLNASDVDASAAWYEEVLGFRRVGEFTAPDGARRKVFLGHDGLQARLGLTQHRHGSQHPFDETRAGLDH